MPQGVSATRWITDDFGRCEQYRRCAFCQRCLLLSLKFFSPRKRDAEGYIVRFDARCRDCRRQSNRTTYHNKSFEQRTSEQKVRYRKMMADPERAAERREANRKFNAAWRAAHPERTREIRQRYREREKRDPAKLKRRRERKRMQYRLERERAGVPLEVVSNKGNVAGCGEYIPASPLQSAIERYGRPDWMSDLEFADLLGVSDRTLREWRNGRRPSVTADVADRVITSLDMLWWEVYTPPPNGHKVGRPEDVLRYISDAWTYLKVVKAFTGEETLEYA